MAKVLIVEPKFISFIELLQSSSIVINGTVNNSATDVDGFELTGMTHFDAMNVDPP